MRTNATRPRNIDDYIAGYPHEVQATLEKVRMTIQKAAPKAEEAISYQIPTFDLNGEHMVYFAAYKNHISLYPAPRGVEKFKKELSRYKGGKGTVQFPLDKPIPFGLITRIVKHRAKETMERAKAKTKKK